MWPFSSRQSRTADRIGRRRKSFRPCLEALEDRNLLSTFTVVNSSDSGPGSLRQAIMQVNQDTQPAADTIAFAIGSGQQTIVPLSALPALTHPVIIDGTAQPGFAGTPLIELDGASAGSGANGLTISGGNSTVQGLVINRFARGDAILLASNGNTISGCYLGTDVTGLVNLCNANGIEVPGAGNTIGGTTPSARNLISGNGDAPGEGVTTGAGVLLEGDGNVVEGNFIGTNVTGAGALTRGSVPSIAYGNYTGVQDMGTGNTIGGTAPGAGNLISCNDTGVYLFGSTGSAVAGNTIGPAVTGTKAVHLTYLGYTGIYGNVTGVVIYGYTPTGVRGGDNIVGGTTPAARNLISANYNYGIDIKEYTSGNHIEGNYIGTDATGNVALGNRGQGMIIISGQNTVGGTTPGAGNVISGNAWGVSLEVGNGNLIQGNDIGTDATGTKPLGNKGYGIYVSGSSANTIGGTSTRAGNIIGFNGLDGVSVYSGAGNAIEGNSIFANGGLGIDLNATNKANYLQPAPVLTSAVSSNGTLTVTGTLTAAANTTFTLEFFGNPSGTSQGQTFLGFITVTTNSKGKATFSVSFALSVPLGEFLTATATDPGGDTSEFSKGIAVT